MNDIHGGNGIALAQRLGINHERVLDLSSNTFLACSSITARILAATPYEHEEYPDPWASAFCATAARHEGVAPSQVVSGNGAAELIWLCFSALKPRRVALLGPIFSEYVRACEAHSIPYTVLTPSAEQAFVPNDADLAALRAMDADTVIICLPNNPGALWYEELEPLFAACGKRTIIADLSYKEFLHGTPAYGQAAYGTLTNLSSKATRLIGLYSCTKFFCCPGIRLGYAVADETSIATLRGMQPPWMLSAFAMSMGSKLFQACDEYRARLPRLREDRAAMAASLADTGVFEESMLFSGVSFITARVKAPLNAESVHAFLARNGVFVRLCDTIPGMAPGFLRMQVRGAQELEPLFATLHAMERSGG